MSDEKRLKKLGFNLDPDLVEVFVPPSVQSGGSYTVRPRRITKYVSAVHDSMSVSLQHRSALPDPDVFAL